MKSCLIIDDNNQEDEKLILEKYSKEKQFPITCHIFNPTKRECLREEKIADGTVRYVIDEQFVLDELRKDYGNVKFDLIAIDYNLSDPKTGLEIIRFLKEKNWKRKVPYVIYSGEADKIKEKLQLSIQEVIGDADKLKDFIENYIATNPTKIYNRGKNEAPEEDVNQSYIYKLYDYLKVTKTPMESKLSQKLEQRPNDIFDNIFPDFQGIKLKILADLVLENSERSDRFEDEFIDRCVDHFIYLKY